MRYRLIAVMGVLAAVTAAGPGPAAAQARSAEPSRGTVIAFGKAAQFSLKEAREYQRGVNGFPSPAARYGVDIYWILYRTISAQGRLEMASGVLALPASSQRVLGVVDFEHGTMPSKADAPSVARGNRHEVVLLAGAGYAAVEPDYLGLGLGRGHHPYLDPVSEATASVDMLRAAMVVAARVHRRLDSKVLVTGFSQGGQAAMATARALQRGAGGQLRLGAVAPISGPYDLLHAQLPAALGGALKPGPSGYYLGYWVTSMNRFHHLYSNPRKVFQAPYDATVPGLFNGYHTDSQVFHGVPGAGPRRLFTAAFLRQLAHPRGEMLRLLRDGGTTCTSWVPHVPVRLYAAHGDTNVAYLNSVRCQRTLDARGLHVPLINVGNVDHFPSEKLALPRALRWFEHLEPT